MKSCCVASPLVIRFGKAAGDRASLRLARGDSVDARSAAHGRRPGDSRRGDHLRRGAVRARFRGQDHRCDDGGRCHGDSGDTERDAWDRRFITVHGYLLVPFLLYSPDAEAGIAASFLLHHPLRASAAVCQATVCLRPDRTLCTRATGLNEKATNRAGCVAKLRHGRRNGPSVDPPSLAA